MDRRRTQIDLRPTYIRSGEMCQCAATAKADPVAERRLDDKIEVVCGGARRMPIDDGQFDVVWMQAVWPNIDDKRGDAQRDESGAQGRRPIGAL